jgi:hypothetical protein
MPIQVLSSWVGAFRSRVKESCHQHRRRLRDFCYWRRRGSRPPNAPKLALAPKEGVVVRMVVGSSFGIFARPAWRDASPGGPCVIVDVIFAVVIGVLGANHGGTLGDFAVEVKLVGTWGS